MFKYSSLCWLLRLNLQMYVYNERWENNLVFERFNHYVVKENKYFRIRHFIDMWLCSTDTCCKEKANQNSHFTFGSGDVINFHCPYSEHRIQWNDSFDLTGRNLSFSKASASLYHSKCWKFDVFIPKRFQELASAHLVLQKTTNY